MKKLSESERFIFSMYNIEASPSHREDVIKARSHNKWSYAYFVTYGPIWMNALILSLVIWLIKSFASQNVNMVLDAIIYAVTVVFGGLLLIFITIIIGMIVADLPNTIKWAIFKLKGKN